MKNRLFSSVSSRDVSNWLNNLVWLSYLVVLTVISFTTQAYHSSNWLQISSVLYLLASLYLVSFVAGGRGNLRALVQAKTAALLLLLIVCWQLVQIYLPVENSFIAKLFGDSVRASWFVAPDTISVVPQSSKWLMWSNFFELALFCLTIVLVDTRQRLKQLLGLLIVVGVIHSAIAVVAKYGQFYLIDVDQLDGHFESARGLFVNRNHLAGFCGLTLAGCLSFLFRAHRRDESLSGAGLLVRQILGWRLLLWFGLMITLLAILLSQSRAGFLGLFIGGFLVFLALKQNNIESTKPSRLRAPLLLIGLSGLAFVLYFGQDLFARFSGDMLSIGERAEQWKVTWQAIKEQVVFGYGGGSYAVVFQAWREYADLRRVIYDQSHNHYLHLWLEQGIIGLMLWLAFLGTSIRHSVRSYRRAKSTLVKSVLAASLLVVVSALFQSLVDYNLQIMNMRSYFFVIIALWFVAPNIQHKKRARHHKTNDKYSHQSFSQHSRSE